MHLRLHDQTARDDALALRAGVVVGHSAAILDRIGHARAMRLLPPSELRRRSTLRRQPDRDAFLASHALARLMAVAADGRHPAEAGPRTLTQHCPTCGTHDHGRPWCPGLDVSISWAHADHMVAVAALPGGSLQLGCDLERADEAPLAGPGGTIDVAQWCRIECEVKAGLGTLDERLAPDARRVGHDLTWTEKDLTVAGQHIRLCALAPVALHVQVWD